MNWSAWISRVTLGTSKRGRPPERVLAAASQTTEVAYATFIAR